MDLLKAMQTFVATIEVGSLVAAADRLGTSSAAVSRQISALEAHLGARLLMRTTRRQALSPMGEEFYNRARLILADMAEAEAVIGAQATKAKGVLRVNAPLSLGITRLSRWLPQFATQNPELRLDIDLTDRLVDLAAEGVDVALRIGRQPGANSVIARKIAPIQMIVCASPAYFDTHGEPETPEDLARHKTLSYSYLASNNSWTLGKAGSGEVTIQIDPLISATNGDILREFAIAGFGVIVQPAFIVDHALAQGLLKPTLTDWTMDGFSLYAVYSSRTFVPLKVRLLIDFLLAETCGESI